MTNRQQVLTIQASAIGANWRALNRLSNGKAGAVVKTNAYGLGIAEISKLLWDDGARDYFVANVGEARNLASALPGARIFELSGFSAYEECPPQILPVINSLDQYKAYLGRNLQSKPKRKGKNAAEASSSDARFALQFDTGMTRLGIDPPDIPALKGAKPDLVMSHLACADDPSDPMNESQLARFREIIPHFPDARASLCATAGIFLGSPYHFDLTRPGIGIYGGAPFYAADPAIQLKLPVISIREIEEGTQIGYGGSFRANRSMRVACVLGGYADGISRALSNSGICLYDGDIACPVIGRISMDLITADISALKSTPKYLHLFHIAQNINDISDRAGTIPHEMLTSLAPRAIRKIEKA